MILLDLSKAFDTINTETILPSKLKHYGFDTNAIKWINSFFHNRQQYTTWLGNTSELTELHNISVVQGSSLGPTSFNYYINDLVHSIDGKCTLYADDTTIVISGKTATEVEKKANRELEIVEDFMKANKLSLNAKKSVFLTFKPKGMPRIKPEVKLSEQTLQEVEEAKFLGITVDNRLTFKSHFTNTMKKLKSAYFALCQTKRIITFRNKMLVNNSLFKSHLEYCCLAWLDKLTSKQLSQLETLQKKTLRAIFNAKYNSHTHDMFELAKVTRVRDIFNFKATQFMWKVANDQQPKAITSLFTRATSNLRSSSSNKYSIGNSTRGEILYNLIHEWNDKNDLITNSESLATCKWKVLNQIAENAGKNRPNDDHRTVDAHYLSNYMQI